MVKKLLSPKQKRIVDLKIKGMKSKDIGKIEYPTATPGSQEALVSRELAKPLVAKYVEQSKLLALQEYKITWDTIIAPIADALQATKQNQFTGEVDADHSIRLSASRRAQELLQSIKEETTPLNVTQLEPGDEVELTKAIFRKGI